LRAYLDDVDFEGIKQRFEAFWKHEAPSGPLLSVQAPREKRVKYDFPLPEKVDERWTDVGYVLKSAESHLENTVFLGDAIPWYWPNLGPNSLTAFLGGDLVFLDESTSWVSPFVQDLSAYEPRLDEGNRWWRLMNDLLDSLCGLAKGNFLVGIPDLHYGGDSLAAAIGTRELIRALYCQPEEVKRLAKKLSDICIQVFDTYYRKISRVQNGCITWIPAYSNGKYFALQDDFTGFLSANAFREFLLEEDVIRLSRYLGNSFFHLDGPMALGNLDTLLRVGSLDGIQWVPGAGAEPMSKWVEVCKKVLDAGKCLQISCGSDEVQFLLSKLKHDGLFISTYCGSEKEANALLKRVGLSRK
jgi:hypothetical protein